MCSGGKFSMQVRKKNYVASLPLFPPTYLPTDRPCHGFPHTPASLFSSFPLSLFPSFPSSEQPSSLHHCPPPPLSPPGLHIFYFPRGRRRRRRRRREPPPPPPIERTEEPPPPPPPNEGNLITWWEGGRKGEKGVRPLGHSAPPPFSSSSSVGREQLPDKSSSSRGRKERGGKKGVRRPKKSGLHRNARVILDGPFFSFLSFRSPIRVLYTGLHLSLGRSDNATKMGRGKEKEKEGGSSSQSHAAHLSPLLIFPSK